MITNIMLCIVLYQAHCLIKAQERAYNNLYQSYYDFLGTLEDDLKVRKQERDEVLLRKK